MKLDDLSRKMEHVKAELLRFGVISIHVFGSVSRGDSRPDSDVDLLVDFRDPPTYDRFCKLRFYLEDLLGCKVDLVTRPAIRPEVRALIEQDLRRVA